VTIATMLKRPATKEVVSAPPEVLFPCRNQLLKLLAEHAGIVSAIEDFESRLQRSELDLNFAIENDGDDIDVSRHQTAVSVFNLKVSAKRSSLAKLVSTLPSAISAGANEYSTLLLQERDRRIAILAKRIGDALGTDSDRLVQGRFLDDLWDEATAVQAVDQLRLSVNLIGASSDTVLTTAHTLLGHFEALIKAAKEQI
jgi:hypothetical protein